MWITLSPSLLLLSCRQSRSITNGMKQHLVMVFAREPNLANLHRHVCVGRAECAFSEHIKPLRSAEQITVLHRHLAWKVLNISLAIQVFQFQFCVKDLKCFFFWIYRLMMSLLFCVSNAYFYVISDHCLRVILCDFFLLPHCKLTLTNRDNFRFFKRSLRWITSACVNSVPSSIDRLLVLCT